MKLYVLDNNGAVVFEFSERDGGMRLAASQEAKVRVTMLLKAALKFLQRKEK